MSGGASHRVEVGNAFDWLKQGWAIFIANPGVWMAIAVILIVIHRDIFIAA